MSEDEDCLIAERDELIEKNHYDGCRTCADAPDEYQCLSGNRN